MPSFDREQAAAHGARLVKTLSSYVSLGVDQWKDFQWKRLQTVFRVSISPEEIEETNTSNLLKDEWRLDFWEETTCSYDDQVLHSTNQYPLHIISLLVVGVLVVLLSTWTRRRRRRLLSSDNIPYRYLEQEEATVRQQNRENPVLLRRSASFANDAIGSSANVSNSPTTATHTRRERSSSMDMWRSRGFSMGDLSQEDIFLQDEFGVDSVDASTEYYGPALDHLTYTTYTPPPTWQDASLAILPQVTPKLKRTLQLDVGDFLRSNYHCKRQPAKCQPRLVIAGSGGKSIKPLTHPIADLSLRVQSPPEAGVLEIYSTQSSFQMEHTFESAKRAAQFQLDFLANQIFGPAVYHMYEALELVHQGSVGTEMVLHFHPDKRPQPEPSEENAQPETPVKGIAWDDVMRALNSIPSVRVALERLWFHHHYHHASSGPPTTSASPTANTAPTDAEAAGPSSDTTDSSNRRLLLGPVDFFRLFVPLLPPKSVPQSESCVSRMEKLLRWRKRAARAALLVRAYTRARTVINQGWHLTDKLPLQYIQKRVSFDDNVDNARWDAAATNEYYEGAVSRDILCRVRASHGAIFSPFQAYSLVNIHIFRLGDYEDKTAVLQHYEDPVMAIPSLRKVVEANPDLEFVVTSFFPEGPRIAMIHLYVRSLPRGIDKKFDTVMDRFISGGTAVRDRKLGLMIQLGKNASVLSMFGWASLKAVTLLLRLTRTGREIPQEASTDRTPLPTVPLETFGGIHHFGGAMATPGAPPNYVAWNIHCDSKQMANPVVRHFYKRLEGGVLSNNIADFTVVLEGESRDELPERALCTIRIVHIDATGIALPVSYSASKDTANLGTKKNRKPEQGARKGLPDFLRMLRVGFPSLFPSLPASPRREKSSEERLQQVKGNSGSNPLKTWLPTRYPRVPMTLRAQSESDDFGSVLETSELHDPIERAIDELEEILDGVEVRLRQDYLNFLFLSNEPQPQEMLLSVDAQGGELINVPVLNLVKRTDIKRYFVAAKADLKAAASRIVQSTAWRGLTFPIDIRSCRVELQTGQFFQQGTDKSGNPVFYFRNMCLGPWRKDPAAFISAVLHRLEMSLIRISDQQENDAKCTLIVLMGRPSRHSKRKKEDSEQEADTGEAEISENSEEQMEGDEQNADTGVGVSATTNPRLPKSETWQVHTNAAVVHQMIDLLETHYPERLSRALVVIGHGNNSYFRAAVGGRICLSRAVASPKTRSKVTFLRHYSGLREYVDRDVLTTIAGGTSPVDPAAFEVR